MGRYPVGARRKPGATMGPDPKPLLYALAKRSKRIGDCIIVVEGKRDEDGYARVWWQGRGWRAHRAVWIRLHGPTTKSVLHHCDTPPCINPAHLYSGTQQDNMTDRLKRGRWKGGRPMGSKNGARK